MPSLPIGHENDNETKLTEKSPHSKCSSKESHNDIPLTGYYIAIKWQLWKETSGTENRKTIDKIKGSFMKNKLLINI